MFFGTVVLFDFRLELIRDRGFPGGSVIKTPPANAGDTKRLWFDPWIGKIPWRRKWQPTPIFLPGISHRQRSLVSYSPCGCVKVGHDLATEQQEIEVDLELKVTCLFY